MEKLTATIDHVPENVLLRIKKLLAQASKGNNSQAEAELCMERATRMLQEWNIEQSQVEATGDHTVEKRVKSEHERSAMYNYQRKLWGAVAEVNFCLHWAIPVYRDVEIPDPDVVRRGWTDEEYEESYGHKIPRITINKTVNKRHYIVGRQSNVTATKMMGDYLEEAINRLCPYKKTGKNSLSWKEGCTDKVVFRLRMRMWDERKKAQKLREVSASEGAMILLNDVYLTEYERNIDEEFGQGFAAGLKAEREEKKRQEERHEMAMDCPEAFTPEEYQAAVKHFAAKRRQGETRARRETAEYSDKNMSAWFAGRQAGEEISLDPQIGTGKIDKSRQIA